MAVTQALMTAKKELRTLMKAKLSSIQKTVLDSQSQRAFYALILLKHYEEAKRISVYLSMPHGEIQTDEIVRHALNSGKEVFVPYLHKNEESINEDAGPAPKRVMDMVRLNGLQDYEGLERDAWGIPTIAEKGADARERLLGGSAHSMGQIVVEGLDLMLMPGVAFSLEGQPMMVHRLGHGKGFYDYFLHRYRRLVDEGFIDRRPLEEYGLALEEQFLQDKNGGVPVGPHDSLLSGLIVGNGEVLLSQPSIP